PYDTLPALLPTLVRQLADKKMVVWHCSLSQVRGPTAAGMYMKEREKVRQRMEGEGEGEKGEKGGAKEQEVYVLEGGFTAWQALYGEDESLTEGWVRDIWRDED
ncbi:MAG: hypothetical protein Q9222_007205, partial [Ikaeria aurantiellina]